MLDGMLVVGETSQKYETLKPARRVICDELPLCDVFLYNLCKQAVHSLTNMHAAIHSVCFTSE